MQIRKRQRQHHHDQARQGIKQLAPELNFVLLGVLSIGLQMAHISEQIDGAVASSAGGIRVIWLFFAHQIRFDRLFGLIAKPVSALQLPTKVAFLRFAKPSFIERAQKHGLEVHFWTINSAEQMSELILMGADGLVTDRADLARQISDSLA